MAYSPDRFDDVPEYTDQRGAHRDHFEGAAAAGAVLGHRRRAPALLQVLGQEARHDVGGAAGRGRDDDADLLGGPPARPRGALGARGARRQGGKGRQGRAQALGL